LSQRPAANFVYKGPQPLRPYTPTFGTTTIDAHPFQHKAPDPMAGLWKAPEQMTAQEVALTYDQVRAQQWSKQLATNTMSRLLALGGDTTAGGEANTASLAANPNPSPVGPPPLAPAAASDDARPSPEPSQQRQQEAEEAGGLAAGEQAASEGAAISQALEANSKQIEYVRMQRQYLDNQLQQLQGRPP
ncbi:hypothetical protein HaLaN_04389, partial [Haematococcus lacustris]